MAKNAAMAEAAQMAEENMDLFRRALRQKAAKRQAAATARPDDPEPKGEAMAAPGGSPRTSG